MIQVLSEQVANQIAAGEVVERPASVIKELVENALDSGAAQIEVRVQGGGLAQMVVQDNGLGIAAEEIETAFVRHATSKLRAITDFSHLQTLGFRGEALPSIASVSKVTLRTRRKDDLQATEVEYHGGTLARRQPSGGPVGTRVQVDDLFYNTPARLKFVRSLQTETAHIVDVVERAALAHPEVAFTFYADERLVLQTAGDGKLVSVFAAIHGLNVAKMAMVVTGEHPDYLVQGLVSAPEHARANRNVMWFAINGRPIRSPMLMNAVLEGFGTTYHKGRFPITYLALTMAPTLVDVNVHPGKLEVRFSEEKDVRAFVEQSVRAALQSTAHIPGMEGVTASTPELSEAKEMRSFLEGSNSRREGPLPEREAVRNPYVGGGQDRPVFSSAKGSEKGSQVALWSQQPVSVRETALASAEVDSRSELVAAVSALAAPEIEAGQVLEPDRPSEVTSGHEGELRAVAQVLKSFIVAEDGESVYLVDQHAAHERVLYERFRAKLHASTVRELPLLVPLTFELRPTEVDLITRQQAVAKQFGLEFEAFGENALVVRSIPNIWEGLDAYGLIRDVFDEWLQAKEVAPFAKLEDKVIMNACKAAIKANQTLSLLEMNALLKALSGLENPFTCPHGRPTALRLTRADLERRFLR